MSNQSLLDLSFIHELYPIPATSKMLDFDVDKWYENRFTDFYNNDCDKNTILFVDSVLEPPPFDEFMLSQGLTDYDCRGMYGRLNFSSYETLEQSTKIAFAIEDTTFNTCLCKIAEFWTHLEIDHSHTRHSRMELLWKELGIWHEGIDSKMELASSITLAADELWQHFYLRYWCGFTEYKSFQEYIYTWMEQYPTADINFNGFDGYRELKWKTIIHECNAQTKLLYRLMGK